MANWRKCHSFLRWFLQPASTAAVGIKTVLSSPYPIPILLLSPWVPLALLLLPIFQVDPMRPGLIFLALALTPQATGAQAGPQTLLEDTVLVRNVRVVGSKFDDIHRKNLSLRGLPYTIRGDYRRQINSKCTGYEKSESIQDSSKLDTGRSSLRQCIARFDGNYCSAFSVPVSRHC